MTEVHQINGGAEQFARLIRDIKNRVASLETRSTGSIFISDQIITADPITGIETYFGALPDGTNGILEYVNDIDPPPAPTAPLVTGARAVFEVSWDGGTSTGEIHPPDYVRTLVEMSDTLSGGIWVEVGYLSAAGSVSIGQQPYGEIRFFRLVSVDTNGNRSIPSSTASATLVSFMESPEMTTYIGEMEDAVTTATANASTAQSAAEAAQIAAENAERLAQEAGNGTENLVTNNSFELDLDTWTTGSNPGSISTTEFYAGTKSWAVGATGGEIYQPGFPVEEGQIYSYELTYKTIPGYSGAGGLRLQSSTDGVTFVNVMTESLPESTSWTTASKDYTVTAGVTHLRARIAFSPATNMGAWVDAVKLTNVTTLRMLEETANEAKTIAEGAAQVAADAAEEAGLAQTAANGKNRTWYQATQPAGTIHSEGDTWFDTDNDNEIHVWENGAWVSARDAGIVQALNAAQEAEGTATTALNSANGKNKNTTSSSMAPLNYVGTVGDIWWQKSTDAPYPIVKQSRWDGSVWVEETFSHEVQASIDLGKATIGELDGDFIKARTITANKVIIGNGSNLLPDPQFEFPSEWAGGYVQAQDTGMNGGGSFLIGAGTTQRGGYLGLYDNSFRVPVIAGQQYRIGAWVRTDTLASTTSLRVYGRVYSSTNSALTFAFTDPSLATNNEVVPANTWTLLSEIVEIPTGYDQLVFGMYVQPEYAGSARFSDPFVQQATGQTLISEGAVTTDKIAAGAITAESGVIGSLDMSKATVGEMDAIHIKAGSIYSDRLVVGQGENFIVDAHFPAPVAPTSTTAGNLTARRIFQATTGASWSSPNRIGWGSSTMNMGQRALKLGNSIDDVTYTTIPVIPGRRYVVAWRVYSDATHATIGSRAAIRWTYNDGTSTYTAAEPSSYAPINAVGLGQEVINEFVAPANAVSVAIDLQFNGLHGGGRQEFVSPSVRLMTDGTIITQDSIKTRHIGAQEITGDVLDMGYIKGEVITANMFEGDTFSGGIFQEATFQTSPLANTGAKMSPELGLVVYGNDNLPVLSLPPTGEAIFKGSVTVTSGSIPMSTVTGLDGKMVTLDTTYQIVDGWASSDDVTLIDGGKILTNSIDADKINLGASANMIPGGYGDPQEEWPGFTYTDEVPPGASADLKGVYWLETNKTAHSAYFDMAGVSKYTYAYQWIPPVNNAYHWMEISYYDTNQVKIAEESWGAEIGPNAGNTYSYVYSNLSPPTGTVSGKIVLTTNNTGNGGTPVAGQWHRFLAFRINVGAETRLTAAGLTSYLDGEQTVRLNGEDNLMVGSIMTGMAGTEPYIRMSSRDTIAAIDLWGPNTTPIHGGIWWEHSSSLGRGILSMFAMSDNLNLSSDSGIKFQSHGYLDMYGRFGEQSRSIKTSSLKYSGGLGAEGSTTLLNYVMSAQITFSTPYPSGTIPFVFVQPVTVENAEVIATVKNITNTGCQITLVNKAPRPTGALWVYVLAVLAPINANW